MRDRFRGILIGTAVGDSLGLPAEGLSRSRVQKIYNGVWRQRLIFGHGMVSDDTEHAVFVSKSLVDGKDSPERFLQIFAARLKRWLLSLPPGVGFATLKSTLKLLAGFSPAISGVNSAGNAPAMRTAVIGALFSEDRRRMDEYVLVSTRVSHTDSRAAVGARAVAYIAGLAIQRGKPDLEEFRELLMSAGAGDEEWSHIVEQMILSSGQNESVQEFASGSGLNRGVTGYVYHTVPVALYSWYRHFGNFRETVSEALSCGGDTDTVGAIAGALAGAVTGEAGIPEEWKKLADYPYTIEYFRLLADSVFENRNGPGKTVYREYPWILLFVRNIFLLFVVLLHGFRRLFPPY